MTEDKTGFSEQINRYSDKDFEMHPFTLGFASGDRERQFREHYFSNSISAFRLSFVTVILLIAAFGYFDSHVTDQYLKEFYIVRFLILVPLLTFVFVMSYTRIFIRVWQELVVISVIAGGVVFIYMVLREPEVRIYYGGVLLVFMAGYFFVKLRFIPALIGGVILLIIYAAGSSMILTDRNGMVYLLVTNAFFVSGNVIAMLALRHKEYLERKGFQQNFQLKEQKREIDSINSGLENQVIKRTNLLDKRNIALLKEIGNRREIEKELVVAKEKAEENDRLKTAFLANMSHEIRTPMNGIMGFAQLLDRPDIDEDKKSMYIQVIQKSGNRVLKMINDLIDISRIEVGLEELIIEETDINTQLDSLYDFFYPEARNKGLEFNREYALSGKDSVIITDITKVIHVMTNLLKNAIKYTRAGAIDYGYYPKNGCLEFYVMDTGVGIPEAFHKMIFDRFTRVESEKGAQPEGAGLGLSISKAYVDLMGGEIWFESEKGEGSTFYFSIPYVKPEKPGKPAE